jgi:hypothetical protein
MLNKKLMEGEVEMPECNEDRRLQRDKAHSMEFLTSVRYFRRKR